MVQYESEEISRTNDKILHINIKPNYTGDEDKALHVRIDIDELVQGRISLATGKSRKFAVKGRFKIESYPGQEPVEILNQLIDDIV